MVAPQLIQLPLKSADMQPLHVSDIVWMDASGRFERGDGDAGVAGNLSTRPTQNRSAKLRAWSVITDNHSAAALTADCCQLLAMVFKLAPGMQASSLP